MSSIASLPRPGGPNDIVALSFQNAGTAALGGGVATFGQAFLAGDLPAGSTLAARVGDEIVPVQVDVKSRHADGSVRMAVLSVERPALAAGQSLDVMLLRAAPPAAAPAPELDLLAGLAGRSFTVDIVPQSGAARRVDVLEALAQAVADGTASFWQRGPLATQARVEVDLPSSQRLLFDVTVFAGGGFAVDAMFRNDEAMTASGGRVNFTAVVAMDGREVMRETVSQGQYQNWTREFSSNGLDGTTGLGGPATGWLNIRHDVGYLGRTGAIADYDTTIGIAESVLQGYAATTAQAWVHAPLSTAGVTTSMGMAGGRADIGIVTGPNSAWLLSGDARAAAMALAQAHAGGSVPWNFWDSANGTWLNTDHYPVLWTDGRGGIGRPGDARSGGLAQHVTHDTGWGVALSHQPELSFVPYLLTGERWLLDQVQAQASASIMGHWSHARGAGQLIVSPDTQLRAAAWQMRQIENAAWAAPDGSAEQAYFRRIADANWKHLVAQIPAWTAMQGEAHGWIPVQPGGHGSLSPWQQDYFASTVISAASRGSADALELLHWMKNFLVGRFFAEEQGFHPHSGVAYLIGIRPQNGGAPLRTWEEIAAQTTLMSWGNNDGGWTNTNGDYAQLGLATLAGIWHLTGDARAREAYERLMANSPPFARAEDFARSPMYAVTIQGVYAGTVNGTDAADAVAMRIASQSLNADLGAGVDRLQLADGRNAGTVRNTEFLTGGSGDDAITLHAAAGGTVVDLGAGHDTLTLGPGGGRVTVANVEVIRGGAGDDDVTLATAFSSGVHSIDLGAGNDRLALSSAGPNRVTVVNVETVRGGAANDEVFLHGTTPDGMAVDLGEGTDTLWLSDLGGAVSVANAEFVRGRNWGSDTVTLTAPANGVFVDLSLGFDRLILSADGPNRLTVGGLTDVVEGRGAADDDVTVHGGTSAMLIDLGAGDDTVRLGDQGNTLTLSHVETVLGGAGTDRVTFGAAILGASVDLGGGWDSLRLADAGPNRVAVRNVEQIWGGASDDEIVLGTAGSVTFDGGAGHDRIVFAAGATTATLLNVEALGGDAGDQTVSLWNGLWGATVDFGAGTDRLVFQNGGRATVSNVEFITGSGTMEDITLGTPAQGVVVDLRGGAGDRLTLSGAGPNRVTVSNTQTIVGGAANDDVTLGAPAWNVSVELGAGVDRLQLAAGNNLVRVGGAETIVGGTGNDQVVLTTAANGVSVNLNGGNDTLTLSSAGPNRVTVAGVETVIGGAGVDEVRLAPNATPLLIESVWGPVQIGWNWHAPGGAQTVNIRDVETILGSAGNDTVNLLASMWGNGLVDLGGGTDRLNLFWGGGNQVRVANVEHVQGGGGNDEVTLVGAVNGMTMDLSSGWDTVRLANGTNSLTLSNVEAILGGAGDDTVTLGTSIWNGWMDGGAGLDRLTLSAGDDRVWVRNVEFVSGGGGNNWIFVQGPVGAQVEGGAGYDAISGGDGDDIIFGGGGGDLLSGGAGADRFVYRSLSDSPAWARDTIRDFDGVSDLFVFEGLLRGTFQYLGEGPFAATGNSQARYVQAWRQLEVDADGDGVADLFLFLENALAASQLSAADFVWT